MATIVVKTIGTGGDYSTLQAWEDACPANLVTADQIWRGEVKNQEITAAGVALTISGTTVDATRYVELTAEAGASFADHASKATNALRYNAANGAAIKTTGTYSVSVVCSQQYTRISKLQLFNSTNATGASSTLEVKLANCTVSDCIIEGYSRTTAVGVAGFNGTNTLAINNVIIQRNNRSDASVGQVSGGATMINCTLAALGTAGTYGLRLSYGATLKNVYVGNVTTTFSGTPTASTNCYTSQATPPSGWTLAAFSTAQFENITDGTHDLRLAIGSALINVGADEATYAANDIIGTARTAGAYDVGALEFSAGGGGSATTTIGATIANITGSVASKSSPKTTISTTLANVAGSLSSGSGSLFTTIAATLGNVVGAITSTGSTTNGTFTSEVLKDYAGNVLANTALNFVRFYNDTTGALVLNKTGVSTNGAGIVTFSDASLAAGTTYRVDWETAAGSRRMPRKAAA